MNNPLNAPQTSNDLVLRLIGGERDGQMFSVQNEKCLLSGLLPSTVDAEQYRCAIFRGEKGVAFRSYSTHVLCNGAKVSVQWLKQGDLIKLTDSFSVEVMQLGTFSKSAVADPKTQPQFPNARPAVATIEIPSAPVAAPDAARVASVPPDAAPATTPMASHSTPSVQFPTAMPGPSLSEAPKFKPATDNLRVPAVTAPLENHQMPASVPAPSPAPPTRTPVHTQPLDVVPTSLDSAPTPARGDASNADDVTAEPAIAPPASMDSAIDALTARLSKLVDVAAGNDDSQITATPTSVAQPSVVQAPDAIALAAGATPLPDTSAATDLADSSDSADVTLEQQTATGPETASINLPNMPRIEVPSITVSPAAIATTPAVESVDSGSTATPDPQPSPVDESASRRSALESYFAKSGVSLSDALSNDQADSPVSNPVSPTPAPTAAVEAAEVQPPSVPQLRQTVVTEGIAKTPEFDLDSVLAKLEASAATPATSPQTTPSAAPIPEPQSSVEATTVGGNDLEGLLPSPPTVEVPTLAEPMPTFDAVQVTAPSASATPTAEVPVAEMPAEANPSSVAAVETVGQTQGDTQDAQTDGALQSFALLQSLGLDTSGLGEIKKELAQAPVAEELASVNSPSGQTEDPAPEPQPAQTESVADVLARMQSVGSLEDFKTEDNESDSAAIAEPTAPPITVSPQPEKPAEAHTKTPSTSDDDDGSVEDYMSQLLNRMRGDSEPTTGKVIAEKQDQAVQKIASEKSAEATRSGQPVKKVAIETLTPEEFVPKQKAFRMQSLDSLREIANSSAREAFRDSVARERTVSSQTKLKIALISLAFAVLFFGMSYMMQEQVNFWGVVCGLGFLVFGILTARTYLNERKLDESIISD